MPTPRPTIAEIDLSALRHNLEQVRKRIGHEGEIFAVVKADAYGHGAVRVARTLYSEGIRFFGVATAEEGIELRENGLDGALTILGGVSPGQYDLLFEYGFIPVLYNLEWAEKLSERALEKGRRLAVWVKVDTGMGRLGFLPEEARDAILRISELSGLTLLGVFSHFADADLLDREFTDRQLQIFVGLKEELAGCSIRLPYWHLANSAAVMSFPAGLFNMVRPGIMLYGYGPSGAFPAGEALRPVLSWRTRIQHLKEVPPGTPLSYGRTFVTDRTSRIATLPVGYADGYPRSLSNRAEVLVRGKRAPVVGRVTMDMILADVTGIEGVGIGDRVTLMGEDGAERISAWDLAMWADTIAYEILCGIRRRVPRVYITTTRDRKDA